MINRIHHKQIKNVSQEKGCKRPFVRAREINNDGEENMANEGDEDAWSNEL